MKACDTNIVVRFLTVDDPRQAAIATDQVSAGLFISHGVLIETEWVLRSRYGWSRDRINAEIADLLALESVAVDRIETLYWALDRHRDGAYWADMLHLIASQGYSAFVTFDDGVVKGAGADAPLPVEVLK